MILLRVFTVPILAGTLLVPACAGQGEARLCEDVAMLADETVLSQISESVKRDAPATIDAANLDQYTWILDRSALQAMQPLLLRSASSCVSPRRDWLDCWPSRSAPQSRVWNPKYQRTSLPITTIALSSLEAARYARNRGFISFGVVRGP